MPDKGSGLLAETPKDLIRHHNNDSIRRIGKTNAIVKRGGNFMKKYTGWIRPWPRKRKPGFVVELYCPSCGRIFTASRIGTPCKSCTEPNTYPASKLPCLGIGMKVESWQ